MIRWLDTTLLAQARSAAAPWIALAAMLVGITALLWTLRRQLKRRAAADPRADATPAERLAALRAQAEQRQTAEAAMAEALELAQRLAAQLDAKAARLERLIADAEDRIRRLERAAERAAAGPDASAGGPDPVTRQVYALADEGLPPVEIARRLSQHTGKVELILALRSR